MAYFRCGGGGIPSSLKTDMNNVLNKKFGTQSENYPPEEWPDDVNLMGLLPIRTASGTIAHFEDGADDVPLKSLTANIVPVQSGTGTPSPSNPRPISGTSVLNVEQRGKNLFDTNTEFSTLYVYAVAKNVLPSATCTMSFTDNDTTQDISGVYFGFVSSDYTGGAPTVYRWGVQNGAVVGNITNLSSENMTGLFYYPNNPTTLEKVLNRFNIQIELGNTATAFEPYKSETYTIDLGQEILGGTADVVGGVGTKNKYIELTGEETEQWRFVDADHIGLLTVADLYSRNTANNLCNLFAVQSLTGWGQLADKSVGFLVSSSSGLNTIGIKNTDWNSITDMKTFLASNTVQLYYELATPTEYTFTGQPINSYLGVNNLYTDSGEVLDVEYRADMNLLIAELEN